MREIIVEKVIMVYPISRSKKVKFTVTVWQETKLICHIKRFNILPLHTFLSYFIWISWYLCKFRALEERSMSLSMLVIRVICHGLHREKEKELEISFIFEVIMPRNLRTQTSLPYLILRGLLKSFLLPSPLSRMMLLRGRIASYMECLELGFM